MEQQDSPTGRFTARVLPWIVAAGALLLYLITLNHWVTFNSLQSIAKVTNWDWWSLSLQAPLFYLLTWPVRSLPSSWQPPVLNFFSALCAAAALGMLARSVALLPHDRTREQRQRVQSDEALLTTGLAWIPPVFAALICGLQLTFWENATTATGEALDLLLFAYVTRCLLEYRVDGKESRLYRMAFVYGLAVTNNWAMIGFFPAFLVALVWIQKLRFFNGGYLLRMIGCGLLGLTLYLLLPILEKSGNGADMTFWQLMRAQLGFQKQFVLGYPKYILLLCSLSSVLPVFLIGFRFPSSFGDTSIVGSFMTHFMYRFVQAVLLAFCLFVAFDPVVSPRQLALGFAFLPAYYLGALSIGYFSGYFLLVCGVEPPTRFHRVPTGAHFLNRAVVFLICAAAVVVPAVLAVRSYPGIRANNSPHLAQYASHLVENLPAQGAILLSDEPQQLMLVEAILARRGVQNPCLLLDARSGSLPYHVYQHNLVKKYPGRWPDILKNRTVPEPIPAHRLLQLMMGLSRSNALYYLHPAHGYYGEGLVSVPRGLTYALERYQPHSIASPPLTAEGVTNNMAFWRKVKTEFDATLIAPRNSKSEVRRSDTDIIRVFYSRSVNQLGTELQRQGLLEEASQCFDWAREFNPENWVAWVNQEFNRNLRTGPKPVEIPPDITAKVRDKYPRWFDRLHECGPFDEPRYCFEQGENFATSDPMLSRQAAQQFLRVRELNPGNLEAGVWLANLYLKWPFPEKALEVVAQLEAQQGSQPISLVYQVEFVQLKAWAYAMSSNQPMAIKILREAQEKNPGVASLPDTLAQVYMRQGDLTNALTAWEQTLRIDGNRVPALVNVAALYIQAKRYAEAIAPLTKVLELEPKNDAARFNRAIANLGAGQLDDAERDYTVTMDTVSPDRVYKLHYGLGDIAWQRKDNPKAIEHYQKYLSLLPRDPQGGVLLLEEEDFRLKAVERLKQLGVTTAK